MESPFPWFRNFGNPLQLTLRSRDVGVRAALYSPGQFINRRLAIFRTVSFLLACCAMFFQGGGIVTYSMIGCVCFILAVLILWSIVASWEEVAEDKPVPPAPELQEEDNGTININSPWLPPDHGDANSLKLSNSPQGPCQPTLEARGGFLSTHRRSHDSQGSTV